MLSEERIKEIVSGYFAEAETQGAPMGCLSPEPEIRLAAAEATAAERERLMEVVCPACGLGIADGNHEWSVDGSEFVCYDTRGKRSSDMCTYAEYLRLHPEGGS